MDFKRVCIKIFHEDYDDPVYVSHRAVLDDTDMVKYRNYMEDWLNKNMRVHVARSIRYWYPGISMTKGTYWYEIMEVQ